MRQAIIISVALTLSDCSEEGEKKGGEGMALCFVAIATPITAGLFLQIYQAVTIGCAELG